VGGRENDPGVGMAIKERGGGKKEEGIN